VYATRCVHHSLFTTLAVYINRSVQDSLCTSIAVYTTRCVHHSLCTLLAVYTTCCVRYSLCTPLVVYTTRGVHHSRWTCTSSNMCLSLPNIRPNCTPACSEKAFLLRSTTITLSLFYKLSILL